MPRFFYAVNRCRSSVPVRYARAGSRMPDACLPEGEIRPGPSIAASGRGMKSAGWLAADKKPGAEAPGADCIVGGSLRRLRSFGQFEVERINVFVGRGHRSHFFGGKYQGFSRGYREGDVPPLLSPAVGAALHDL